jgi:hypothetical protein
MLHSSLGQCPLKCNRMVLYWFLLADQILPYFDMQTHCQITAMQTAVLQQPLLGNSYLAPLFTRQREHTIMEIVFYVRSVCGPYNWE